MAIQAVLCQRYAASLFFAKEITCVGKGDSECSWITRTQKEWESDMQEELDFYHETPIMEELEYTYEQLAGATKIRNTIV